MDEETLKRLEDARETILDLSATVIALKQILINPATPGSGEFPGLFSQIREKMEKLPGNERLKMARHSLRVD
jgi:hypothetical protein